MAATTAKVPATKIAILPALMLPEAAPKIFSEKNPPKRFQVKSRKTASTATSASISTERSSAAVPKTLSYEARRRPLSLESFSECAVM